MALFHCNFFSEVLSLQCSMYVYVPQTPTRGGPGFTLPPNGWKTLYLLHGMGDDHSIWLRRTSIERYVVDRKLAVVMPAVHRSYYTNMAHGYDYFTFIAEEVPAIARQYFRLSSRREDNFVAGLSMGGFGSFKIALTHPDRFAAAASMSGALDPAALATLPERVKEFTNIFGPADHIPGSENDLFSLSTRLVQSGAPRPRLWMSCGTEDFLIEHNRRFRDHLRKLKVDFVYEEGPGNHEWAYWDTQIQRILKWLPL